jgi:hypothetical protein
LPKDLKNRVADNWRPLIAIADSFGPYWAQALLSRPIRERMATILLASRRHNGT